MNRVVNTLLLILLIQCGLTAAVYWPQVQRSLPEAEQTLAPFDPEQVDEIRVGDDLNNEAVLNRRGDQWVLPQLDGLPADPRMVGKLLDSIARVEAGWPIARSRAARQRFQVADYHHQRRLDLRGGGAPLATLYLGTSPGYRKVHARNSDADAIYSIAFNVFDAPGSSAAWIDPRLLQIRVPVRVTADAYSVHRVEGDWQSAGGTAPDERELQALLSALRSLQVEGPAGPGLQDSLDSTQPDLILEVESLSGNITLKLFSLEGERFIHSSEYPLYFALSDYDFDRLTSIDFLLLSPRALPQ